MKRRLDSYVLFALIVFVMPFVSADIFLSQPNTIYSLGDEILVNASISSSSDINNFFVAKIVCDNGDVEFFKSPYFVGAGEQKNIVLSAKIDSFLISSLRGECVVRANYGSSTKDTQSFKISDTITLSLNLEKNDLNPGEAVLISGSAMKDNGQRVNGEINVKVDELNIALSDRVVSGMFNISLQIPDNAPAKIYTMHLDISEKDSSDKTTNKVEKESIIRVNQVVRRVDLAVDNVEITPPGSIVYRALLFDQAESDVKDYPSVSIFSPSGDLVQKRLVKSGESNEFKVESNYTPGYWNMESSLGNLSIKKSVNIKSVEKASFYLTNKTLYIENVGNVPYSKSVEVKIGSNVQVLEVSLGLGQKKKYVLSAPNGEYGISIKEGDSSLELGTSYLTGKAISVRDYSGFDLGDADASWVWIILIIVFLLIAALSYERVRRRKFVGKTPNFGSHTSVSGGHSNYMKYSDLNKRENVQREVKSEKIHMGVASSSGFGRKEGAAVLAVKIKNMAEFIQSDSTGRITLDSVLQPAREAGAKIYDQGEFKVMIFSKNGDENNNVNLKAVKVANNIDRLLREHNQRYSMRVDYGIGVHYGEFIVENINGKTKFTSMGGATIIAKKAADLSNGEILMSQILHRMLGSVVKAEAVFNRDFWKVKNIIDREANSDFINRFMKRQRFNR